MGRYLLPLLPREERDRSSEGPDGGGGGGGATLLDTGIEGARCRPLLRNLSGGGGAALRRGGSEPRGARGLCGTVRVLPEAGRDPVPAEGGGRGARGRGADTAERLL